MTRVPLLLPALLTLLAPAFAATAPDSATLFSEKKQQELFDALDLSQPGLQPVREALVSGDSSAARQRLATWLRSRNQPPLALVTWRFTPHRAPAPDATGIRYNAARADAAAQGRVVGGLVELEAVFPDNRIDWFHDETKARASRGESVAHNAEWQWQLNRMAFWGDLAGAYRISGDERYARAWVTQFRSFIEQCPAPGRQSNGRGSAWRTIECGIRMSGSWPAAFHGFLLSPSVSDDDLLLYLHASLEHARYLEKFPSSGNWLTMEMNGLYTIGVVFPEFKDAARWRQEAIRRIYEDIAIQFLPDGAQYELTPGYHAHVALGNAMAIPRFAKIVGRLDEIPPDYVSSLERAHDYILRLATPDRSLPEFNDSWPVNVRNALRGALAFFPQREDFRWIGTDGREGRPPTPPGATASYPFDYAGYYVMRSGWETDANYAVLDAGPLGAGHWHQDKLNLVLWAYGRELLFDSGGGSYENSPWRRYATDTFSHNTVLVDGKPQRRPTRDRFANVSRTPLDVRWESTPRHDYAIGLYYEGYGSETDRIATHLRRVYFHKPDVFIVADTLLPNDSGGHTYQARWHLLTTQTRHDAATGQVVTTDAGQPNLAVIPLMTSGLEVAAVSGQTEPEILGWDVRKDTIPQCVPATTVLHTRRGSGPQNFLTLLVPLRPGADASVSPVAASEPAGPGALRVTFADGRILILDTGTAPDSRLTVSEKP